jgi:exodeoxyribonuclease V alpha subunit
VYFPTEAGGLRDIAPARLPDHETAFAMTVHKAQGSEFDHAVLALPPAGGPLLTRELIYTAITRARQRFTLLEAGTPDTLSQAIDRQVRRASGLRDTTLTRPGAA